LSLRSRSCPVIPLLECLVVRVRHQLVAHVVRYVGLPDPPSVETPSLHEQASIGRLPVGRRNRRSPDPLELVEDLAAILGLSPRPRCTAKTQSHHRPRSNRSCATVGIAPCAPQPLPLSLRDTGLPVTRSMPCSLACRRIREIATTFVHRPAAHRIIRPTPPTIRANPPATHTIAPTIRKNSSIACVLLIIRADFIDRSPKCRSGRYGLRR